MGVHCSLSTGKEKLSWDPQRYHMTIPPVEQTGRVALFSKAHSQNSLTQGEGMCKGSCSQLFQLSIVV